MGATPALDLIYAMVTAVVMVLLTVLVHYRALSWLSLLLQSWQSSSRWQIIVVVIGVFAAHTVAVWAYAVAYWLLDIIEPAMTIDGHLGGGFLDYLYFSTVSYTSLGLGDLYPTGALRLVTGVEALNGLIMITWSASFTYLVMERRWRF